MYAYELCRKYQDAVNRKDIDAVDDLFVPGAKVKAPLSGITEVRPFHAQLFAGSRHAIARLINVYDGVNGTRSIALRFQYTWVMKAEGTVVLDGMNIFEVAEDPRKFSSVTIIYDPTELRRNLIGKELEGLSSA